MKHRSVAIFINSIWKRVRKQKNNWTRNHYKPPICLLKSFVLASPISQHYPFHREKKSHLKELSCLEISLTICTVGDNSNLVGNKFMIFVIGIKLIKCIIVFNWFIILLLMYRIYNCFLIGRGSSGEVFITDAYCPHLGK